MDRGSDINRPFRYDTTPWNTQYFPSANQPSGRNISTALPLWPRIPPLPPTARATTGGRTTRPQDHVRPVSGTGSRPTTAAPDFAHAPDARTTRSPAVPARSAAVPTGPDDSPRTPARRAPGPLRPARSPARDTAARRTR